MGKQTPIFDWLAFFPALGLNSLGLITILSVAPSEFGQQLLFSIISLLVFWIFYKNDFAIFTYIDKIIYITCLALLLLTFLGPNIRGATRWLEIGNVRLQPSEIVKPFLILCWSSFIFKRPIYKIKNLLLHFLTLFIPVLLLLIQPDLGNAIVYIVVWLSLLIISGMPFRYLVLGTTSIFLITPILYNLLYDYQKLRLLTFINPQFDPQGAGYHAVQSMITIGSGLWLGKGFGKGTQSLLKFLPERHTDFIFAAYTEVFGFVGGMILIGIFFYLLWNILGHIRKQELNIHADYYITGIFMLIFIQMVINIGMNVGILPITGITLPLVSYGGSSLLSIWIGLGIFMSSLRKAQDRFGFGRQD